MMRPKGRVWRYELHGGCQLCCLSRRWLDARAERGASQIGRHIATRRRASCFATGRHAMLRSWLRSTRRAASCNQFIFSAAIWIGTISPASSRISRSAAAIWRGLHVWGLVAGGSHVPRMPRARWRPADRQPTAWMLLARLYRSVGGLWWVADGYGHAVLWNVTADLGAGHPTGLYPFSGIANAIRPTQTARFHQIARRGSGGAVSRRTCAADGDRNGTR